MCGWGGGACVTGGGVHGGGVIHGWRLYMVLGHACPGGHACHACPPA